MLRVCLCTAGGWCPECRAVIPWVGDPALGTRTPGMTIAMGPGAVLDAWGDDVTVGLTKALRQKDPPEEGPYLDLATELSFDPTYHQGL